MQTTKTIPLIGFALLLLSQSCYLTGQGIDCKVLITGISGKYSGGCRKGLAHGKGTAQGMDTYAGKFKRGLPDGTGIYTWADGSYYEGQWKAGKREGCMLIIRFLYLFIKNGLRSLIYPHATTRSVP